MLVQRVLYASTKCVMCYYNVNTGTIGDMTQAHIAGSSLSNTCMSHYILNPQSVFLCVGCRLGGFVPLSGFFHGFVGHFYQPSRTYVDSLVYIVSYIGLYIYTHSQIYIKSVL